MLHEFLYSVLQFVFYPTSCIFILLKVCSPSWTCKFISLTKLESFDLLLQIFFSYLFSLLSFLDSNDMLDDLILSYKSRTIYFSSIFFLSVLQIGLLLKYLPVTNSNFCQLQSNVKSIGWIYCFNCYSFLL